MEIAWRDGDSNRAVVAGFVFDLLLCGYRISSPTGRLSTFFPRDAMLARYWLYIG